MLVHLYITLIFILTIRTSFGQEFCHLKTSQTCDGDRRRFVQLSDDKNPFFNFTFHEAIPASYDVNDDGLFDMVFGEVLGGIEVLLNTGNSTHPEFNNITTNSSANPFYGIPKYSSDPKQPTSLAFGDLSYNDDNEDFLFCPPYSLPTFHYYINEGNGNFRNVTGTAEDPFRIVNPSDIPNYFEAVQPIFYDFNLDGLLDLEYGTFLGAHLIHLNEGNLTLLDLTHPKFAQNGTTIFESAAGNPTVMDLDGDNDGDLIVGTTSGSLRVYLGMVEEILSFKKLTNEQNPFESFTVSTKQYPHAQDINGDGWDDLIVGESISGQNYGSMSVFLNEEASLEFSERQVVDKIDKIDIGSVQYPFLSR